MADGAPRQGAESRSARRSKGKSLRGRAPRSSHGMWTPAPDRPDPIGLLQAQDEGRLEHLLPIKYGRMVESPFAFLRGSAVVMAADLATTPRTGLEVVLCGDAHLANFGVFATPERKLTFDINDFDETYPGPWEWDVKRLAASAVVAGRENGFSETACRDMAVTTAQTYRGALKHFAQLHVLDVWYYHVDAEAVLAVFEAASSREAHKSAKKMVRKARSRTHQQTLEQLTCFEAGERRIVSDPPLLVPLRLIDLDQVLSEAERQQFTLESIEGAWGQYLASLPDERRYLLQRFQLADGALRVGGVGSVGTRCSVVLLEARDGDDALLLQLKEAGPSALDPYLSRHEHKRQAARVVIGQRLMQASSDIFLGWHSSEISEREFYWRQLKDMKGSADVADLDKDGFRTYIALCSWCLARAHARTGDEVAIWGYIGKNDTFAEAIADFAVAYANQTERDHEALAKAVACGRIAAETGI